MFGVRINSPCIIVGLNRHLRLFNIQYCEHLSLFYMLTTRDATNVNISMKFQVPCLWVVKNTPDCFSLILLFLTMTVKHADDHE